MGFTLENQTLNKWQATILSNVEEFHFPMKSNILFDLILHIDYFGSTF